MSTIDVSPHGDAPLIEIRAYGGTRRERGAAIGAEVRRMSVNGVTLTRYHLAYSETPGFQTMTLAKYRIDVDTKQWEDFYAQALKRAAYATDDPTEQESIARSSADAWLKAHKKGNQP